MVQLTIATEDGVTFNVDVDLSIELENFMALLEAEVSVSNAPRMSVALRERKGRAGRGRIRKEGRMGFVRPNATDEIQAVQEGCSLVCSESEIKKC